MFELEEPVELPNGRIGVVIAQLGKETNDPNEEPWYEVEFRDDTHSHYSESELEKV